MNLYAKEPRAGDVFGRYQLLMPIAKGGMGQVWAARQTGTRGFQKLVAIKTILPHDDDAMNLEAMLFEEASLASLVRHPNVAETLDLGEQDGTLYLVMEWVDGEPLDYILRAARSVGGIPIAIAVHLIVQACKGLHAAHEAKNAQGEAMGLVHRDISPQNLLVTYSGVVKLVDFGVAKATQQMSPPTTTGQVKGKFAYMSPEQVQGEQLDARADVFAMGIVLYRLTTGKHPFKSDNPAATVRNILMQGPAAPSELVPGYPPGLEVVVMKALARERTARYPSAEAMMLALEQSLPEAVRAHADKNTEVFLHRLLEPRIQEKSEALRTALAQTDAGLDVTPLRLKSPPLPRSFSTLRAVAVEAGEDGANASPEPSIPVIYVPPERPAMRKWPFLVAAAACFATMALVFVVREQGSQGPSAAASLHAASAGDSATPEPALIPERTAAVGLPTPEPSPSTVPAPAAESSQGDAARKAASPSHAAPPKKRLTQRVETSPAGVVPAAETSAPSEGSASADPLNRRK